ncbi:acetyl-CoA synthetase-like protein [Cadophora sp. DSE1049]|nr:acetyl-CoA synthetase-like protein [Cadophora sp. DSE1049]
MATESPFPPIKIPEIDIWDFIFEGKRPFSDDQVVFVDAKTSRQYTLQDVKDTAIAFGHALRTKWNWQKGDVVGIYSSNCVDTPAVTFGTLWAGGIVSPANPASSVKELAFQLKDSGAKALVTHVSSLKIALQAAKLAGMLQNRILLMGDEKSGGVVHMQDFIASARETPRLERHVPKSTDLSFLVYSSGTTGLPKGVMLTHRNIVSNTLMTDVGSAELQAGDVLIAVLPLYHRYGLALLIVHSIHRGAKVVVMPAFEPQAFLGAIQEHKVTFAYLVPPIVLLLAKSPIVDNYDLRSVKMIASAAAPLTLDLIEAVWKRLKIPIKQAWGMSEASPAVTTQLLDDWQTAIGSVGKILPNQLVKVVNEAGELLPAGEDGEFWVKGPNVFPGYLNNPEATANCMTEDGYMKTGDIGHITKDGHVYITDRLKELIKYKGFQVAPAELEGLLVGHEKVADACVLGVWNKEQATEVPRAYVVKTLAARDVEDVVLEKEVVGWVAEKVAGHKRLRGGVVFVDEIPKSAAGKILRRILRDKVKADDEAERVKSKL